MKDEPVVAFLKFTSCEEHAKSIIDGKFYSNTVKYFRDLERETKIRGQGDINELLYNIPYAKIQLSDPETKEIILESNKASATIFHQTDDNIPLVCFVGIKESDLILTRDCGDKIEYKLPFTDNELAEMATKFGKYCVFISPDALIKRLVELSKCHRILFKPINYVEENNLDRATSHFKSYIDRFFFKDKDLAYQREYRLCIYEKMPDDHCFRVNPFNKNEARYFNSSFLKNAFFYRIKS